MKKAYNFLWMGLAPVQAAEAFKQPIPLQHIDNLQRAARVNPDSEVLLWVDSGRLSKTQLAYLHLEIERNFPLAGVTNVQLRDLRSIPEYQAEEFYNVPTSPNEQERYISPIWGQVDSARLLALSASLKEGFAQAAYADLDLKSVILHSAAIQEGLNKNDVVIGRALKKNGDCCAQNGFMIFTRKKENSLSRLYAQTIAVARQGQTGYRPFLNFVRNLKNTAPEPDKLFTQIEDASTSKNPQKKPEDTIKTVFRLTNKTSRGPIIFNNADENVRSAPGYPPNYQYARALG